MDIYHAGAKLEALKEHPFKLEKHMQVLFEANLPTFTGLKLVKSEYVLKQYRFDTLAYEPDKSAFVIIEYKRDKNQSVVDQGVSYLNTMLEYKDSLIIEYNEQNPGHPLKRNDVDWSQSRILFVANAFTPNQKQATNFKDLGIELIEFKRYQQPGKNQGDLLTVNFIQRTPQAPSLLTSQSALPASKAGAADKQALANIAKEIKDYDEPYHLEGKSQDIIELYQKYRDAIMNLDDSISIGYLKHYIAFKKDKSNVVDIKIQNQILKLWVNARQGKLNDPKHLFKDVTHIGHLGNGDYQTDIRDTQNLEYILSVIKQAL